MTSTATAQQETRDRLLEAAGQVFAERGFHQATIREICDKAGANVASVNYYFRGKEDLYIEVLKSWARVALEKYPPLLGLASDASAEDRLRAFIKSFLYRLLDEGRPAWHGRLIAQEMAAPTPAFDTIMTSFVAPNIQILMEILGDLLDPGVDPVTINRLVASVVGQIVFYHHGRSVLERISGPLRFDPAEIEDIAEHIAQFSLAGMRQAKAPGLCRKGKKGR